jgi:rod shape-determining protein MreC
VAIILIIISCAFIFLDGHSPLFHNVRRKIEDITSFFQYAAAAPERIYGWERDNLASREKLLAENKILSAKEIQLNAELAKVYAVENENEQLRALLSSADNTSEKVAVAQILALNLDDSRELMVLNKGSDDDVYIGQPVVDASGVFGQIIDTSNHLAKLMLITDKDSRIPVVDSRSRVRSIARGLGSSQTLDLINVLNTQDIKLNDVFVTSGLGLQYPAGYPVAKVVAIKPIASSGIQEVILQPLGGLSSSSRLLLIWHKQIKLQQQVNQLLADNSYMQHDGEADGSKI